MPVKLKQGAKGRLVQSLQEFLNLKGKLSKAIPENGEFGPETKEAVKYFQKKFKLTKELDGTVGPETANALADLIGSKAAAFAKAFGEVEEEPDESADAGVEEKKPAIPGKPGKHGNSEVEASGYVVSIPPDPADTLPLVLLFAGITHIAPVYNGTPPNFFKKAIVVFSEMGGSFSAAQGVLKPLLAQTKTKIGAISICGYSGGAQAAFRDYGRASKAVGLIDPAVLEKDLSKLDSKAIFSCNGNNWSKTKYGDIIAAQYEAEHHINGGVYEKDTGVSHEAYPKYFLSKFESSLI